MKTKIVFLLFALNLFLLPHYFSQGCNPTDLNCYINNGDVNYLRNPQIPFEINYSVNEQSNSITLRMKFNRSDNNCPNIFPNFFASLTSVTSSQQATTVSWLRNSVDGLIEEVNYHENEPYSNNGQLFYDWSYVIELDDNTSTQDRQFFLYYYYYDNGVQKILQEFLIKQNPSILYYLDSDKDGFGDYDAEGVLSAVPIEGDYVSTNNYDQCPNDPYPANNGCRDSEDVDFNWIETKTYNIKKNLLSNSRNYFDQLGKPIQTQSYDIKEKRIWSTQTLYDEQGRPALQTLSAPITSKNTTKSIQYYSDFIKNEQGNKFPTFNGVSDLLLNQKTVGIGVNTLGWYYSTNNTDEPYQDITDRPYSRTIYSTLNPGTVKQTIGGNKVKDTNNDGFVDDDDDWVQGYSFSMPAAQEMYYVFGYDHFETSPDIATTYTIPESITNDSSKQINWLKATKTVIEDVQGNQSVVFTDTDGKTLAAARVGISETPGKIERKFNVLSLIGTQKYIDVHIPQGCTGVLRGSSSNYKVYNLKTEISINLSR